MKDFENICLRARTVCVFKEVMNDEAVSALIALLSSDETEKENFCEKYSAFVSKLYKHTDDLSEHIKNAVFRDENIFVINSAKGICSPLLSEAAENELDFFSELSLIKSSDIKKYCPSVFLPSWDNKITDLKEEYEKKIASAKTAGYGIYAEHRMFLYKDGEIVPVKYPDPQRLSQMSGYELERQKVIDNTLALIGGRPCNNVLLYGDAGSGKSSTVKAVVNEFYKDGLRLIEIKKNQLYSLPEVLEELASNPLKFIIFIDDLSFSSSDSDFGALKAILEGGVAGRTRNIAIYATSNRRNLVRESFADREGDDIHIQDTIQEITSLSARFGLKITFSRPNKDLYLSIVENLASQYNIITEKEELFRTAEAFALRNGGRSPRTAKQFIEYLASK